MSDLFIQGTLFVGVVVVIACIAGIVLTVCKHWKRQRAYVAQTTVEDEAVRLIEKRLPDIRLANRGFDIDQAIEYIRHDSDIEFSMGWGDDDEQRNL